MDLSALQTWIATGGMLRRVFRQFRSCSFMAPAITATHFGWTFQNGDAIDESMASPDVAKNAPVRNHSQCSRIQPLLVLAMTGASNLLSSFSVRKRSGFNGRFCKGIDDSGNPSL